MYVQHILSTPRQFLMSATYLKYTEVIKSTASEWDKKECKIATCKWKKWGTDETVASARSLHTDS